jgi:hypothetical protein
MKKQSDHNVKQDAIKKVCHLQNSIYYFLQRVSIIQEEEGCRLLIMSRERLLDETMYKTVRGARISFSRRYKNKLWEKGVEPLWGPFYTPGNWPINVDAHIQGAARMTMEGKNDENHPLPPLPGACRFKNNRKRKAARYGRQVISNNGKRAISPAPLEGKRI